MGGAVCEFRLLGPLEVRCGDRLVAVGGTRPRTILALLLLSPGRAVTIERLIDQLYGESPPTAAVGTLHTAVCRLRKALTAGGAPELLRTTPGGYLLAVEPERTDVVRFTALLAAGQRDLERRAWPAAERHLDEALGLWRGPALADVAELPAAQAEISRLEQLRLGAMEGQVEARLALGRSAELVPALEHLTALHPLRERLAGHLMVALYRCQRQADALGVYARLRHTLAEELGIDPGPALRALHESILRQDRDLLDRPEASSAAGADTVPGPRPVCRLPHRTAGIVGRADLVRAIGAALEGGGPKEVGAVALHGLAGVGKTRVAIEYAHQTREKYDLAWWVPAGNQVGLVGAFHELARALGLPSRDDQRDLIESVLRALRGRRWLLIFDNAERVEDVSAHLPAGPGHALITSRNPAWRSVAHPISVPVLHRAEAVALIHRHTEADGSAAADQIAELLGDLPLALVQASAYIEQSGMPLPAYAQLLRRRRHELLSRGAPSDHPGIAATWQLALERVARAAPSAINLLRLGAYLSPDGLDLTLLTEHAGALPAELATVAAEEIQLNDQIRELLRYSLIDRQGSRISAHRLVHDVVRAALDASEQRRWLSHATALVGLLQPAGPDGSAQSSRWDRMLPHLVALGEHAEELATTPPELPSLLHAAGRHLVGRAAFDTARELLERAVRLIEPAAGDRPGTVAGVLTDLGDLQERCGQPEAARRAQLRVLELLEGLPGAQTEKALALSRLGNTLTCLGDLSGAVEHLTLAVSILVAEEVDDVRLGAALVRLGWARWAAGDLPSARDAFERALGLSRAGDLAGPEAAHACSGLGLVLQDTGELAGALDCQRQALDRLERIYGRSHPEAAHCLDKLGYVHGLLGDLPAARRHHLDALAILTDVYGGDHVEVAMPLTNLGVIAQRDGDDEAALDYQRRAMRILEHRRGWGHPHTQVVARRLAVVLAHRGDPVAARGLLERVVSEASTTLGENHPDVALARADLRALPVG